MKIPHQITRSLEKIESVANTNCIELFIDHPVYNEIELIPILTDHMIAAVHMENKKVKYLVFNQHVYDYAMKEGFDVDHVFDAFNEKLFTEYLEENFCQYLIDHHN